MKFINTPIPMKVYEAKTILKALEDAAASLPASATAAEALMEVKKTLEKAPTVKVYDAEATEQQFASRFHIHTKRED